MSWRAYTKYRDSGVGWLGSVPDSWPVLPVKRRFRVTVGKMLNAGAATEGGELVPYLRAGNVQPDGLDLAEVKHIRLTATERKALDLCRGDLVVVEGGAGYGRSAFLNEDMPGWAFQNHILRVRPTAEDSGEFLGYVIQTLNSMGHIASMSNHATIPSLSSEQLARIQVPLPCGDTQRAILAFLDRETSKIDALIAKQEQLIATLQERRSVVADQLLNPPGLLHPLKRIVADVTVGIVVTPAAWYADEGVPALRGLNIRPGLVTSEDLVYLTPEGDALHAKSRLRVGDVVMVRTGQAGAAAVIPKQLSGSNAIDLLIVRPGAKADPDFLAAYFNAPSTREKIAHGSVGAIQGHFNVSALRELEFPSIDIAEQRRRAEEWSIQAANIDALIAKTEAFIELSREYRSALITDAVTGKIDVRGAA